MRRIFFLFFFFICFLMSGQEYQKLLVEGNSWSVVNWSWGWAWTDYFFLEGDTVINDTTYAKLYFTEDSTLQSDVSYFCGLREDTSSKEVFFYYNTYNWGDRLLYKFGLDIGDTITVTSLACEEIFMTVSDVDTITDLSGVERRRMRMDHWYDGYDEFWIDGVGSTLGLLTAGNISCIADYNQDLLCFSQFQELCYMNPMFTICHVHYVSINENISIKYDLKIYPNPVTSTSNIIHNTDINVRSYKLYDSNGKLISLSSEPIIEKGSKSPGIYFLRTETEEGDILTSIVVIR